jgi:hypothetical protein
MGTARMQGSPANYSIGPVPTPKAYLADVIPIVRARPPKAS